jgi:hypothetical protein
MSQKDGNESVSKLVSFIYRLRGKFNPFFVLIHLNSLDKINSVRIMKVEKSHKKFSEGGKCYDNQQMDDGWDNAEDDGHALPRQDWGR